MIIKNLHFQECDVFPNCEACGISGNDGFGCSECMKGYYLDQDSKECKRNNVWLKKLMII